MKALRIICISLLASNTFTLQTNLVAKPTPPPVPPLPAKFAGKKPPALPPLPGEKKKYDAEQTVIEGKIGKPNFKGKVTVKNRQEALLDFAITSKWQDVTPVTKRQVIDAFLEYYQSSKYGAAYLKLLGENNRDAHTALQAELAQTAEQEKKQGSEKEDAAGLQKSIESELNAWRSYSDSPVVAAGAPPFTFKLLLVKLSKAAPSTPQATELKGRVMSAQQIYDALWRQLEVMYRRARGVEALQKLVATMQDARTLRDTYVAKLRAYETEVERVLKK
jgi:hypothetical protein